MATTAAASAPASAAVMPAAQKIATEQNVATDALAGSGRGGRVTKEDVLGAVQARAVAPAPAPAMSAAPAPLQKAKRELAEMEVAERRRQLVPAAVLRDAGGTLGALVRERLAARRTDIIAAVQAAEDPDRALARHDDLLCRDLAAALEEALAD